MRRARSKRLLSLALQGGGSFGAFTWGVLDRLLAEDGIALDTVSGASAGAVNAVILAHGLAEGGPAAARIGLERFWKRLSSAAPLGPFGDASAALELSSRVVSPYYLNPLGLNPLRDILAGEIDFELLRAKSPVRLLIAATQVRDGRPRLFRADEITLDTVLASACLPLLNHAVEIAGEWYWDGGYSANPPLRRLVADSRANDILLVQVMPEEQDGVPHLSREIARRVSQIAFNGPLRSEIEALDELRELCRQGRVFRSRRCRRLQRLRLHRIAAEHTVAELSHASAFDLDWRFVARLKEAGSEAAERWCAALARRP